MVSRSSEPGEEDRDRQPGEVHWADGTAHLAEGFHRIRYYGLQATCTFKKVREQLAVVVQGAVQLALAVVPPIQRLSYRERMKGTMGRDPQMCPKCGAEMWLWKIWHPKYGVLYDAGERMRAEAEAKHEPRGFTPVERRGAGLDGGVVNYRYRCLRCHHEDDVPEVAIDGFAASANPALQPGEMPRLVCPNCGGPFRAVSDSPRERSER